MQCIYTSNQFVNTHPFTKKKKYFIEIPLLALPLPSFSSPRVPNLSLNLESILHGLKLYLGLSNFHHTHDMDTVILEIFQRGNNPFPPLTKIAKSKYTL